MKIISVDNFDRESYNYPDRLHAYVSSEEMADKIARLLNTEVTSDSDRFYRAVPDHYILRKFDLNEEEKVSYVKTFEGRPKHWDDDGLPS